MGTLWLAALRAGEEMARLRGNDEVAARWRDWFERGSVAYDEQLFTGEHYVQMLDDGDPREFQWEGGCLSDQLIGQWWAHTLDLGYILPEEHVRTALRSVVRHNLKRGFEDFVNPYRVYADGADTGLLMCSWPDGGRPAVPTRYCDEVWTGIEYQVAAHCLMEGLEEQGNAILDGLWARYDGRRRNPYKEIECGDHYVRGLAGWSVLEARTGQRWDAVTRSLTLAAPPSGGAWPILLDEGWGEVRAADSGFEVTCVRGVLAFGVLAFDVLTLGGNVLATDGVRLHAGESRTVTGP